MRRYILNRLLLGIITLIGVSIIVFLAARFSGDVTLLYAPQNASPETVEAIRVKLGLDQSIPMQYLIFVKNALMGDLGTSYSYNRPVMEIISGRIPATVYLGLTAFVTGNFIGILLGTLAAMHRGKWIDWGGRVFAIFGQAIPNFWLAVMLMLIFSVYLGWLPTSGIGGIEYLILPVIATSWFSSSFILRITRSSMLDVFDTEYIKLAKIKGNPERVVIWKHALRNSLIPVVTMSGMQLATIIGGLVFTEIIFNWPGIGSLMVNSINTLDYPMIQAITLLVATSVIVINLLVDLLLVVIDPRIKYD